MTTIAAAHAQRAGRSLDATVRALVGVPWSGPGRAPSILNNDGVPLQMCLSSGARGVRVRLIGDPHTGLDPLARFRASVESAHELLDATGSGAIRSLIQTTVDRTLPGDDAARAALPFGALWLGAGVDRSPGVALYTTAEWGEPATRWQRVGDWLAALLPTDNESPRWLTTLSESAEPVSAGLEGCAPGDARVKLYVRLCHPGPLGQLGVDELTDPGLMRFVDLALQGRTLPRTGIVLSVSFSIATGALADVKIDICGHCIPRPPAMWQELFERVSRLTRGCPDDLASGLLDHDIDVAFIGLGQKRCGAMRLNLYLKTARHR